MYLSRVQEYHSENLEHINALDNPKKVILREAKSRLTEMARIVYCMKLFLPPNTTIGAKPESPTSLNEWVNSLIEY